VDFCSIWCAIVMYWLITRFLTWVTWWVSLVEQEILTFPVHLRSPPVFTEVHVSQSFVFCVVLYVVYLSGPFLCSYCQSLFMWYTACDYLQALIYSLWLPPGFDIQLVITFRLWYTACDYLQALIYSLWLPPGFLSTVLILITNVYLIIEGIIMIIDDQSLDDLW
jgi:hypothetical protein